MIEEKNDLQTSLNAPQQEAVNTTDGPVLVLAGAGTGKTKVLTSRIIHIVNSFLASPNQILAVTFTNKAAAEMRNRIGAIIGDQVNNLWVGTFHGIAARILRRNPEGVGLASDFTIIDADDQNRLIKQILTDLNVDTKQFPPKSYLNKISRLKDRLKKPKDVSGDDLALPKLRELYEIYQNRLKMMNAVDFGDILMHNLEIFEKNHELLAYYQDLFKYVLVDEYQDTNDAQYKWLLMLSALNQNICCVGDDDQSIYSWRGANIANILRFEKDFEGAKIIRLEQNYRSTSYILQAADDVISKNKERHGKKLWTDLGQGSKVKVLSFLDDRSEASNIATKIERAIQSKKYDPSQIAILVRAGYQTRSFEEIFIQKSLPYKIIGGMKFYERMEVKDAICYLRICANLNDDLALNRIINTPKRGVGAASIANIYQKSKEDGTSFFAAIENSLNQGLIKGKAKDALSFLTTQIKEFNSQIESRNLVDIAREILTQSGYIQMWKSENTLESQGRIENIEEFLNSLNDFSTMTEFLEYVSLVEAKDEKNIGPAVTIMTVHGAKGLEFDMVFVPGLEDGIFPSGRSVEERNGLEEERRLMYVAITRAKKDLTLSYAKNRYLFGNVQAQIPSRFIKDLSEDHVDFEESANDSFGSSFSSGFSSSYSSGGEKFFRNNDYKAKNPSQSMSWNFDSERPKKSSSNFSSSSSFGKSKFGSKFGSQIGSASSFSSGKLSKYASSSSKLKSGDASDNLAGKRVFHQKFGYGKVNSVDGKKLEIAFEKTGTKIVMKDFVTLA